MSASRAVDRFRAQVIPIFQPDSTAGRKNCSRTEPPLFSRKSGWVPRDFFLELWKKEAIIGFHLKNPLEGYRRLTFMMLDADVVAVSPASVWRVLKQAGLLSRWKSKPSRKGTGFEQPLQPHQHWHIDVSYINLCGTFYYLCSILDGFSRFLVHWDLR
ncbi:MAG: IS3 family transposase [Terriglobales bacterium]